jgi:hypothetical protein
MVWGLLDAFLSRLAAPITSQSPKEKEKEKRKRSGVPIIYLKAQYLMAIKVNTLPFKINIPSFLLLGSRRMSRTL